MSVTVADKLRIMKAEQWEEGKHPRAKGGEFAPKGQGEAAAPKAQVKVRGKVKAAPIKIKAAPIKIKAEEWKVKSPDKSLLEGDLTSEDKKRTVYLVALRGLLEQVNSREEIDKDQKKWAATSIGRFDKELIVFEGGVADSFDVVMAHKFWIDIFGSRKKVREFMNRVNDAAFVYDDRNALPVKPGKIRIPKELEVGKPLEIVEHQVLAPKGVIDYNTWDKYNNSLGRHLDGHYRQEDGVLRQGSDWVTNKVNVEDRREQARFKREIVSELSKRTGIDSKKVNLFIKSWARTSNDESLDSLTVQKRAAELFGSKLSKWQQERYDVAKGKKPGSKPSWSDDEIDKMLIAMYEHTQEQLKAAGITSVKLMRGVHFGDAGMDQDAKDHLYKQWKDGKPITVQGNIMESWSAKYRTAAQFSYYNGYVLGIEVPASRIIGSARTGFGCLPEQEYVVLGGMEEDASVVMYREAQTPEQMKIGEVW